MNLGGQGLETFGNKWDVFGAKKIEPIEICLLVDLVTQLGLGSFLAVASCQT